MATLEEAARKMFPSMKERKGISGGQSMAPAITKKELAAVKQKLKSDNNWTYAAQIGSMVDFLEGTNANAFSGEADPKIRGGKSWSAANEETQKGGDFNYWELLQRRALRLEGKRDKSEEEEIWLKLFQETSRRRTGS